MSNANPSGVRKGEEVEIAQKRAEILELRKAGMTFPAIAKAMGYKDHSGVVKAYQKAMHETLAQPANEIRELEVARLDQMWQTWYPKAVGGNAGALDRCLRIMERRARLLGLDAPTQMRLMVDDQTAREIEELSRQLGVNDPTQTVLELEALPADSEPAEVEP